jgi:hypothetical protein
MRERGDMADLFHAGRVTTNIAARFQYSVSVWDGFPRLGEVEEDSIDGI